MSFIKSFSNKLAILSKPNFDSEPQMSAHQQPDVKTVTELLQINGFVLRCILSILSRILQGTKFEAALWNHIWTCASGKKLGTFCSPSLKKRDTATPPPPPRSTWQEVSTGRRLLLNHMVTALLSAYILYV